MLNSSIIEVAIGLTFLFLLLSLCATAIVEWLTELRQWRGRMLHAKLEIILGPDLLAHFYMERRVSDLASGRFIDDVTDASIKRARILDAIFSRLSRWFPTFHSWLTSGRFSPTSIDQARRFAGRMGARRLPAQIPDAVFADVILDWLHGVNLPESLHPDRRGILSLPNDQSRLWESMNLRTDGDRSAMRSELLRWYNQTTERITGDFKRRIKVVLYVVGLFVVLALNADSIRIAKTLYSNPIVRSQLAASAERSIQNCKQGPQGCADLQDQVQKTYKLANDEATSELLGWRSGAYGDGLSWAAVAGWFITILAIGMGADFWFGALRKVVALKNSEIANNVTEATSGPKPVGDVLETTNGNPPILEPIDIGRAELAPLKGFQPLRFSESNVHAFWLGQLASLAYSSMKELQASQLLSRHSLAVREFDSNGTQAFLFENELHCIVAFRGTEQTHDDWITDAKFARILAPWGTENQALGVHIGFHGALEGIWQPLLAAIRDSTRPVWFTGHSLGGALAVLAAYRLSHCSGENMPTVGGVYTFGQPRVGNEALANSCHPALSSRIFRYVNSSDVVPLVPPSRVDDYSHFGQVRYFDASGRLHRERTLWERIAEQLTPTLKSIRDPNFDWKAATAQHMRERFANHSMARYIQCLERIDTVRAMTDAEKATGQPAA